MPPRQGVHFFAASVSVMSWPSDDSLGVEGDGGLCQSYRMPALQFHCPHCGALYEKTDTKSIAQDLDRVVSVVCWNTVYEARTSRVPLSN